MSPWSRAAHAVRLGEIYALAYAWDCGRTLGQSGHDPRPDGLAAARDSGRAQKKD